MNDLISQLFGLNFNFNRFKDVVINIIWILGLLGIGIDISPLKFNPIKSFVKFVFSPFRTIVKEEVAPIIDIINKHGEEIDKINKRMEEKEAEQEEEKLSDKRWKILNFGDQLRAGNEGTKEMYDYISTIHDKYVVEIKKKELSNGVMDATWEYIENKYKEHMSNNDFIG